MEQPPHYDHVTRSRSSSSHTDRSQSSHITSPTQESTSMPAPPHLLLQHSHSSTSITSPPVSSPIPITSPSLTSSYAYVFVDGKVPNVFV